MPFAWGHGGASLGQGAQSLLDEELKRNSKVEAERRVQRAFDSFVAATQATRIGGGAAREEAPAEEEPPVVAVRLPLVRAHEP